MRIFAMQADRAILLAQALVGRTIGFRLLYPSILTADR
jgi:hypothetical protein